MNAEAQVQEYIAGAGRRVLFLQGPITPFFRMLAGRLEQAGCQCYRINLCFGDWLFWRGRNSDSFRGSREQWQGYIENYLADNQITDLILLGEQRFYHKIAIDIARQRNIQVVTTDFGYLRPDWIVFERNGMSANSEFPRSMGAIQQLAETAPPLDGRQRFHDSFFRQVVWDMQYHLLSSVLRPLYPGYRSHQIYHPVWVYLGTGLRLLLRKLYRQRSADKRIKSIVASGRPYFVFPLQMQNDFQIRAYSQYEGVDHALGEVIKSFAEQASSSAQLVVKVHPLDPGMIRWSKLCQKLAVQHDVAGRVTYIDGGSLNQLIQGSSGVVTINSTVGIWALRQLKPVCVLGEAVYRIPHLVHCGELQHFWQRPQQPDAGQVDAFLRALAATIHVRGVYYNRPGLENAVEEAAARLLAGKINATLLEQAPVAQAI